MELHTKDLNLRPVGPDDVEEVARMWEFEKGPIPHEEAYKAIEYMQKNHRMNKIGHVHHFCLGVFERGQNKIVGWCGLDGKTAGKLYIFYSIDPDYRNKGYATQSAQAMLSYAFNEMQVPFVNGGCAKDNISSSKVMTRIGMLNTGHEENGDPIFFIDKCRFACEEVGDGKA